MRLRTRSRVDLPQTRRADEGRRLVGIERQADALERPRIAVEELGLRIVIFSASFDVSSLAWAATGTATDGPPASDAHWDFRCTAVRDRARTLSASTATVIRSAPVQASFCHSW